MTKTAEKWSGREDSNLRPLPPEQCCPASDGGISPDLRAGDGGTNRKSGGVAGTVAGTDDPTFTSRADLVAWAKEQASVAGCAATMAKESGDPEHAKQIYVSALERIKRVTLAHVELP